MTTLKNDTTSDLRTRLLESATKIIRKEGIGKLTMRALAGQVGVSRTAPYLHFKSKAALLSAIAEGGFKQLTVNYQKINNDKSLSTEMKLQCIGLAYIRFAIDHPGVFSLMFSREIADNKSSGELLSSSSETFTVFIDVVKAFQIEWGLTDIDFISLVNQFWSTVHGLADLLINNQIQVVGEKHGYPTLIGGEVSDFEDETSAKIEFAEMILKTVVKSFPHSKNRNL